MKPRLIVNRRNAVAVAVVAAAAFLCLQDLSQSYRNFTKQYPGPDIVEIYVKKFAPVREDLPKTVRVRYLPYEETRLAEEWLHIHAPQLERAVELAASEYHESSDDDPVVRMLFDFLVTHKRWEEKGRLSTDEALSLLSRFHIALINELVRYALAPHRVTGSNDADYVIGAFPAGSGVQSEGLGSEFEVVKEYQSGLVLFRRRSP